MIKNSFVLLDGVGYKTEARLWRQSIFSWEDFIESSSVSGISNKQKKHHDLELEAAKDCLTRKFHQFFRERLKSRDHWRLYPEFKESACFLDIETTGLSHDSDITMVGIFDGKDVKSFVKGINLDEEKLREELSRYKLLITFYGSVFDMPFIMRKYPSIKIDVPHIDLCFASRRVGFSGGLKAIERGLGIDRDAGIKDIDGFEAVRLWKRWEKNQEKDALESLIEYNKSDVVNLKALADEVYHRLWEKTFNMR